MTVMMIVSAPPRHSLPSIPFVGFVQILTGVVTLAALVFARVGLIGGGPLRDE